MILFCTINNKKNLEMNVVIYDIITFTKNYISAIIKAWYKYILLLTLFKWGLKQAYILM